jgi:hypothetical protein
MSEQKKSFMEELDLWTQANVIDALYNSDPIEGDWGKTVEQVKKAIRTRVLESYRNGQGATPGAKPSRPSSFRPRRREFAN